MRVPSISQPSLGSVAILGVKLNTNCRDEIIPILRALQHIYGKAELLREILDLVGGDVNGTSSTKRGRTGMDYWQIVVLAAVRLGCNLDYDKLQDLAEQHRALRQIMGLGDWDEHVQFDWRRIRDNIDFLRPETLKKINELVVGEGHKLVPEASKTVRGDSFVVETNIHYPTDSGLIGDGLRKIVLVAAALAKLVGAEGWRQHQHLLKKVRTLTAAVSRASRSKGRYAAEKVQQAYEPLFDTTDQLRRRARDLEQRTRKRAGVDLEVAAKHKELKHYLELTEKVCGYSKRRVLHGEVIDNSEKIFSMFEPHTELIRRGKARAENQFGHNVLVIEDGAGFVCAYQVLNNGVQDRDVAVPTMHNLQERLGGRIKQASFDRSFHSPENQEELAKIVRCPCVPMGGEAEARQRKSIRFRRARQNHPGIESAIGALQAGNGLERCRDRTKPGYERYVGLGILGRNLQTLGKTILAREQGDCQAAKSKRKPEAA